jgi:hypothetical protein
VRLVMPIVSPSLLALESVRRFAPETEIVDVSSDDLAYYRLARSLWAVGEDFGFIEQDVVIRSGTISSFECPAWWCAFGYTETARGPVNGYWGCVRFRSELMAEVPGLFETPVDERSGEGRTWQRLAATFATVLGRDGYRAHRHEPGLVHDRPLERTA